MRGLKIYETGNYIQHVLIVNYKKNDVRGKWFSTASEISTFKNIIHTNSWQLTQLQTKIILHPFILP